MTDSRARALGPIVEIPPAPRVVQIATARTIVDILARRALVDLGARADNDNADAGTGRST